jgi:hypothetical protein
MSLDIRYLRHKEIDKAKWDRSVSAGRNGMIYARSWYLDTVSPGWDALVAEDYTLVMPLPWRMKYGIKYLFQPPFTQQLGLFSLEGKPSQAQLKKFIQAIPGSFKYIDQFLNYGNNLSPEDIPEAKIKPRLTHHLSLDKDYEKTRKEYSDNLARNLRKAASGGITVIHNFEMDELISLFRKNRGERVETLATKEYAILRHLTSDSSEEKSRILVRGTEQRKPDSRRLFRRVRSRIYLSFFGHRRRSEEDRRHEFSPRSVYPGP